MQPQGPRPAVAPSPGLGSTTVGGNDLLGGLAADGGPGMRVFEAELAHFVEALPIRPVLLGTVYQPHRRFRGTARVSRRAVVRTGIPASRTLG